MKRAFVLFRKVEGANKTNHKVPGLIEESPMGKIYMILNQKSTHDLCVDLGKNVWSYNNCRSVGIICRLSLKCRHNMPTVIKVSVLDADCPNDCRYKFYSYLY